MNIARLPDSKIRLSRQNPTDAGFTIIELMIALSILSLVLLLSTIGIVQIGKLYSKGMIQVNTQNAARNIMNNIASQIQLSGVVPQFMAPSIPSSSGAVCIGSKRYSFMVNHQLTKAPTDHALWLDVMNGSSTCLPITALSLTTSATPADSLNTSSPNNGSELLSTNMRLTDLDITSANGFYTITVSLAYGDDDLISYTPRSGATPAVTTCKGGPGSEYCAIATLTQTIAPRMAE